MASTYDLDIVVRRLQMGDFFLLYTIGKNVDTLCFRDIVRGISVPPTAPADESLFNNGSFQFDTYDRKLRAKMKADEDTSV